MADETIKIKFIADIANAIAGFRQLGDQAQSMSSRLKGVGSAMTLGVTVPIVSGLALATKQAIDFDKAMTGVSRAANLEGDMNSGEFAQMSREIRQLAPTVGILPTEFAKLAAESAKLGVSKDRILGFTKTVGEVAQIGDLAGEQVNQLGQSFAALQSITGANDTQLRSYAAAVNALDDNIGGTMPDIIEFTRQTAASGKLLGIGTQELAAYGSAMQSLGIKNGVAYRTMNALMTKLAAPQTLTETAVVGLESLGFSVEELSSIMKRDAEGGIRLFLERVKEIGEQDPQKALGAVKQLIGADFGDETLTLALGMGKLSDALKIAGNDTANFAKYQSELVKKQQSVSGQLTIAQANLQSIGISLGLAILPALNSILGVIAPLVSKFADFAAEHPKIVMVGVAIAGVVAAIGPLVWITGSLIASWGTISTIWGAVSGFLGVSLIPKILTLGSTISGWAIPAIQGLIAAAGGITLPFTLAVGAIGLLIYNIRAYAANWDDAWLGMKYTASSALDFLGGLWDAGWEAGAGLIRGFVDGMKSHFAWATSAMAGFTSSIRAYLPFSPSKEGALKDLDKSGGALIQTLVTGIQSAAPNLTNTLDSALGLGISEPLATAGVGESSGGGQVVVNFTVNLGGSNGGETASSLLDKFRPIAAQIGEEIERALGKSRRGAY